MENTENLSGEINYSQWKIKDLERALCLGCTDTDKPIIEAELSQKRSKIKKDMRGWGIGLLILGIIHIAASGVLDPMWGIIIMIIGIINIIIANRFMYIVNGLALILVGIMNLMSGGGGWSVFGIMQLYWGGQEIFKFIKQ